MSAVERAATRLDRPDLGRLVAELHRRFGAGTTPTALGLGGLSHAEQVALADLFGSPRLAGASLRLPVHRLAQALRLNSVDELRPVVELLRGPVVDRSAERSAEAAARDQLWAELRQQSSGLRAVVDPNAWVDRLQHRTGVRGGVEQHRRWLARVVRVLSALPADGLTLAELAQDTLGDPHGLDAGRSVAAAVLDALEPASVRQRDAETTRAGWETAGVAPDALSSTVLALGLGYGVAPDHPVAGWWDLTGRASEPTVHTLSQLRRWPAAPLPATSVVVVVENPSLIAAAARGGWNGPALLCSSGRPTVAVLTLLRQLTAHGATAFQHADFDPPGLAITRWLAERCGTQPWRMGAADYRAALPADRPAPAVENSPVPGTPWDPDLSAIMAETQLWVYEEQVRDLLLAAVLALP